jgi:POT family proton-dependent oligopeptide transporter
MKPEWLIYGGTFLMLPLVVTLFHNYEVMDYIMFGLGIISLIYVLSIGMKLDKEAKYKLFAALVMIVFSIVFWAVYEQNAGSMNLLAERNSQMTIFGIDLPELAVNNFLPPGWVILLTLLVAPLWPWLARRGKEPSTPLKFAISFIFLGIGFYVFYLGCWLTRIRRSFLYGLSCWAICSSSWENFAYHRSVFLWLPNCRL